MRVVPTAGLLSYVSPAYMGFASVRVTSEPAEIKMLVKGRRQIDQLERALADALNWARDSRTSFGDTSLGGAI